MPIKYNEYLRGRTDPITGERELYPIGEDVDYRSIGYCMLNDIHLYNIELGDSPGGRIRFWGVNFPVPGPQQVGSLGVGDFLFGSTTKFFANTFEIHGSRDVYGWGDPSDTVFFDSTKGIVLPYDLGAYGALWAAISLPSTPSDGETCYRWNTDLNTLRLYYYVSAVIGWKYIEFT